MPLCSCRHRVKKLRNPEHQAQIICNGTRPDPRSTKWHCERRRSYHCDYRKWSCTSALYGRRSWDRPTSWRVLIKAHSQTYRRRPSTDSSYEETVCIEHKECWWSNWGDWKLIFGIPLRIGDLGQEGSGGHCPKYRRTWNHTIPRIHRRMTVWNTSKTQYDPIQKNTFPLLKSGQNKKPRINCSEDCTSHASPEMETTRCSPNTKLNHGNHHSLRISQCAMATSQI